MSYDLYVVRLREPLAGEGLTAAVLGLRDGGEGEGFEVLPGEMMRVLAERLEGFNLDSEFSVVRSESERIEVRATPRMMYLSRWGEIDGSVLREILEVGKGFGCVAYDPQTRGLYESVSEEVLEKLKERVKAVLLKEGSGGTVEQGGRIEKRVRTKAEGGSALDWNGLKQDMQKQRAKKEFSKARKAGWEKLKARVGREIERLCGGGKWHEMGIKPESLASVLLNTDFALDPFPWPMGGEPDEHGWVGNPAWTLSSLMHEHFLRASLAMIGAVPAGHPAHDARVTARAGAEFGVIFCYGEWREGYRDFYYSPPATAAETRKGCQWFDPYRTALMLALYGDEEEAVGKLLAFPDVDLKFDDWGGDATRADNLALIAFACQMRGETEKAARLGEEIAASKKKRARVFFEAGAALAARDGETFGARLKEGIGLFRKSGFSVSGPFSVVHVEGTILWHAARRAGVGVAGLGKGEMGVILR